MRGKQCRADQTPRSVASDLGLHYLLKHICPKFRINTVIEAILTNSTRLRRRMPIESGTGSEALCWGRIRLSYFPNNASSNFDCTSSKLSLTPGKYVSKTFITRVRLSHLSLVCVFVLRFYGQATQWSHDERGQFTYIFVTTLCTGQT